MVDIRIELDVKCAKCGEYLDHDEAFGFLRVEPCECILEECDDKARK